MKLYNVDGSPNCFRVRAVIFELGLHDDVELVDVDLRNRSAEFLAASPGGKVPAFVDDDGFTLFESRAINAYLCSKRPGDLYPADPKLRALVDQWSYWQAIHLGPAMQAVAFERVGKKAFGMGEGVEEIALAKLKETEGFLPVVEKALAGKQWLVGDKPTLADFAVASTFPLRKPAGISLDAFPNTRAWIERVEALPSWQKALPKWIREALGR